MLLIDKSNFTKTIWYKLIKILAHLQHLHTFSDFQTLSNLFEFILTAHEKTSENLCFYYVMKIVMHIKKVDINSLLNSHHFVNDIFRLSVKFFRENHKEKNDNLVLEIQLYLIDFFKYLMDFQSLHETLNSNDIVFIMIVMLRAHENEYILKALASALQKAAK